MLRYYKLQHLTVMNKDKDLILIAESNLKKKAESWFCYKVKHSTYIICNWTFKSVVIGLFGAFVTITMAQQAIQSYMHVQFLLDKGMMAFYYKLIMLVGQLTQYPNPYSFRRRLLNGMPKDYCHYLNLYKGISVEHSLIDDII